MELPLELDYHITDSEPEGQPIRRQKRIIDLVDSSSEDELAR